MLSNKIKHIYLFCYTAINSGELASDQTSTRFYTGISSSKSIEASSSTNKLFTLQIQHGVSVLIKISKDLLNFLSLLSLGRTLIKQLI